MPIFSVILGVYWVIGGLGYRIWVDNGPGGGLFPVIAGIILIICGGAAGYKLFKDKTPSNFNIKAFLPIGSILLTAIFSYVAGLILAIGIFVFLWLRIYEKQKTTLSLSVSVCTAGALYLIFDFWLKVPIPMGVLESLLYY